MPYCVVHIAQPDADVDHIRTAKVQTGSSEDSQNDCNNGHYDEKPWQEPLTRVFHPLSFSFQSCGRFWNSTIILCRIHAEVVKP